MYEVKVTKNCFYEDVDHTVAAVCRELCELFERTINDHPFDPKKIKPDNRTSFVRGRVNELTLVRDYLSAILKKMRPEINKRDLRRRCMNASVMGLVQQPFSVVEANIDGKHLKLYMMYMITAFAAGNVRNVLVVTSVFGPERPHQHTSFEGYPSNDLHLASMLRQYSKAFGLALAMTIEDHFIDIFPINELQSPGYVELSMADSMLPFLNLRLFREILFTMSIPMHLDVLRADIIEACSVVDDCVVGTIHLLDIGTTMVQYNIRKQHLRLENKQSGNVVHLTMGQRQNISIQRQTRDDESFIVSLTAKYPVRRIINMDRDIRNITLKHTDDHVLAKLAVELFRANNFNEHKDQCCTGSWDYLRRVLGADTTYWIGIIGNGTVNIDFHLPNPIGHIRRRLRVHSDSGQVYLSSNLGPAR